jgi:ABC-type polysaccharide/polyol phosphate export permease
VVRDLRNRYVGSVGGFVWSVVYPVVLLVCYHFVFAVVFGQRFGVADYGTESFALYLFSGILPWLMFSDTVLRNSTAVTENASLVTKTTIPSEVLPIAVMISNLVHHLIGLTILLVILAVSGGLQWSALSVLIYLPLLVAFVQGLGWLVAGLNVFFRDTVQLLNVLLMLWFWFTPVFYPASMVPERYSFLMAFNPMAIILAGYRSAFLELDPPPLESFAALLAWTAAAFLGGALFFRQSKMAFADVL